MSEPLPSQRPRYLSALERQVVEGLIVYGCKQSELPDLIEGMAVSAPHNALRELRDRHGVKTTLALVLRLLCSGEIKVTGLEAINPVTPPPIPVTINDTEQSK